MLSLADFWSLKMQSELYNTISLKMQEQRSFVSYSASISFFVEFSKYMERFSHFNCY